MNRSIIIIGAGGSGLQAARKLSAAGYSVTILEAGAIPGGRILTLPPGGPGGFSVPVEGGAEFIHGELPLSLALAREAGVELQPVAGQMVRVKGGKEQGEFMSADWGELFECMKMLSEDMPFADFLLKYFSGDKYAALRDSAGRMAEGYDLADLRKASTLSLYREWSAEGDEEEYRPIGGYGGLIGYLAEQCRRQGCTLYYSTVVSSVVWRRGGVEVVTAAGQVFEASKLLITVSLGVLKAHLIRFSPQLPASRVKAIDSLGYGSVIKVLLEFDEAFWGRRKKNGRTLFIISEEPVPTWWTQSADDNPVIIGWISGQRMFGFRALDKEARIESALRSLARIFDVEVKTLRARLKASLVFDWETAASIHGGYSYDTLGAAEARKTLSEPLGDTLFFAGEGLYEGDVPGTVEAAFCSGVRVADKIIAQS